MVVEVDASVVGVAISVTVVVVSPGGEVVAVAVSPAITGHDVFDVEFDGDGGDREQKEES